MIKKTFFRTIHQKFIKNPVYFSFLKKGADKNLKCLSDVSKICLTGTTTFVKTRNKNSYLKFKDICQNFKAFRIFSFIYK